MPTDGGGLFISDNVFGPSLVGAAVYSIISSTAEAQIMLRNNRYTRNDRLLIRFGGVDYTDLADYQTKTGNDVGSTYFSSHRS